LAFYFQNIIPRRKKKVNSKEPLQKCTHGFPWDPRSELGEPLLQRTRNAVGIDVSWVEVSGL